MIDADKALAATNPANAIDIIVKVSQAYKTQVVYWRGNAQFAVEQMRRLGSSATARTPLGNFDIDRIQRLISIVSPIFTGQKKPIKPNLTPVTSSRTSSSTPRSL
ncbi:MAG TPA: hypothetical protein VIV12_00675 [Streptosporangiaceae bacterium]